MSHSTDKTLAARGRAQYFADAALLVHWSRNGTEAGRGEYHVESALRELRDLRAALDAAEVELLAMKPQRDEVAA